MKRLLSIVLSVILMMSTYTAVSAQTDYSEAIARVSGLGIMGNVEDDDFREDDKITRAEFTAVICRLMSCDNLGGQKTVFSDVPEEHWASGYIAFAYDMGWINGVGDGLFMPEAEITYGEAVKILVCVLKYDIASNITFPDGYLGIGAQIGITKSSVPVAEAITRAQAAELIDESLDVNPMELNSDGDLLKSDRTLFEILSDRKDMSHIQGVLTETGNLSLSGTKDRDKSVRVNGLRLYTDKNFDNLLGQYVEVYYNNDDDTIAELVPMSRKNEILETDAEDTVVKTTTVEYYDENGRKKDIRINEQTVILLNGDKVAAADLAPVYHGNYKAIDNDRDGVYNVILITEAESFIVESVSNDNTKGNTILYFKDNRTYHGRKGFVFKANDADVTYIITDKDGNTKTLEDIKPGVGITFTANNSESVVKAYLSEETCSGKITSTDMASGSIIINGTTYKIGKDAVGEYTFNPLNITEGDFVIDAFGYVIGAWEKQKTNFTYAYVENAYIDDSGNDMYISIVSGTEPRQEVKTVDDSRVVSYYLQNDSLKTLCLADKILYGDNPRDAKGSRVNSTVLDPMLFKGNIIGYTLNDEGKVNKINVYTVPVNLSSYEFNGDLFSFGGMRVSRGFLRDEHTQVICVPNNVRRKDDYGVNVKITDGSSYNVYGVLGVSDNEYGSMEALAEPCDVIIVKAEMNSALPPNIDTDNDICIIGKSIVAATDDGDLRYEIDILNGDNAKTYYVPESSIIYSDVASLRKGDLIQFTSNQKDELTSVKKRASVQGLTDYTDVDNIYGEVSEVKYDIYDYYNNEMVDILSVNSGSGTTDLKIFKDDGQKVYLYDRQSGYVYPSTTEDILSAGYFGDEASKLFALMEDNEAKAIVVIWD